MILSQLISATYLGNMSLALIQESNREQQKTPNLPQPPAKTLPTLKTSQTRTRSEIQTGKQSEIQIGTHLLTPEYNESSIEESSSQLRSGLMASIIKEIRENRYFLEERTGYLHLEPAENRARTIFNFMAKSNHFDFLYENSHFLNFVRNKDNYKFIFKLTVDNRQGGSLDKNLYHRGHINTCNVINLAILTKDSQINNSSQQVGNKKFLDFFTPLYIEHNDRDRLIESIKIAVNCGNIEFLKHFENNKDFIRSIHLSHNHNLCYAAYSVKTLDYLKEKFDLAPKTLEDWVEKMTFKFMDLNKSSRHAFQSIEELEQEYLENLKILVQRGVNIEHYKPKQDGTLNAPAVWLLCVKHSKLISSIQPLLNKNTTDSAGSNFLFYLFNNFKRAAPDLKDAHILSLLEDLFYKDASQIEKKNTKEVDLLALLKMTVDKNTNKRSLKLDAFQKFCERLALGYESQKLLHTKSDNQQKRHKL